MMSATMPTDSRRMRELTIAESAAVAGGYHGDFNYHVEQEYTYTVLALGSLAAGQPEIAAAFSALAAYHYVGALEDGWSG